MPPSREPPATAQVLDAPPPSAPAEGGDRPPPRTRAWRGWARSVLQGRSLVLLAVVVVVGYLTLTPLVFLAYGTFVENGHISLGGFTRAYATSGLPTMAANSVIFAAGSALVALVVGTLLAYVTIRTNVPFRPLLVTTAMVPLIIPGLLYTISWIMLSSENVGLLNQISDALIGRPVFDIFSMPGMIWVEATHNAPLVYLLMLAAFRSMDPSLEESALVCGARKLTMLRRITIPLVRPAIAAAVLIVGVNSLASFEVPVLLGLPNRIFVFTSRIYFELQQFPYDYGAAGALSIGLVLIAVAGIYLTNRLRGEGQEFATITGKGFRSQTMDLRRARIPVGLAVIAYFVVTAVLPLLVMLYNSFLPYYRQFSVSAFADFSLDNYAALFSNRIFTRSVTNSLILSLGSATIIMLLTAIAAWFLIRTRVPGRQVVDHLTFLPLVVPGLVMGVAISFVYLRNPLPIPVYGTLGILFIAYVTRFIPYGMRYSVSSLTQISRELEESAEVSGAPWLKTMRRVVAPLMVPGLVAGWIYIVVVSIRELSSSILLYSPGNEVLSIVIFQFYQKGNLTAVSALSVALVAALILFVTIAYKLGAKIGLRTD